LCRFVRRNIPDRSCLAVCYCPPVQPVTTDASETIHAEHSQDPKGRLSMHPRRSDKKAIETILAALLMVVIVVVMSVIIYSWSQGIFGAILPTPNGGKEILTFENAGYNAQNNNITLYLRNTGTSPTTLVSYFVQDLSGNECAKTTGWTKGPYSPSQLAIVPLAISSPACSWTGTPFTFQSGNVYAVTLVTSHGAQFSFTVQR
jgi:hypothetical protein